MPSLTEIELNTFKRYQLELAAGCFGYVAEKDDTDEDLRLVIRMGVHEEAHNKPLRERKGVKTLSVS